MALQHIIGGRTLPDLSISYAPRLVDSFDDASDIPGGSTGASGAISRTEYNANSGAYARGQTWLIRDTDTNQYIWGGYLRDPVIRIDQVELVADGWGKQGDKVADGHFLVMSYDTSQWTEGESAPFPSSYQGTDKIKVQVGRRIAFRIKRHETFKRNTSGNPTKWFNGIYRWVPNCPIKYIAFEIGKSRNDDEYSIEVVTANGPSGALTVEDTISMGAAGPTTYSKILTGGRDLVGVRLIRTAQKKKARKRRFVIKKLRIGSLATSDTYTLNQLFTEVFTRLGVTPSVAASTVNVAPFEAENANYGEIMDENALLDAWSWRIEPNPTTGAITGYAGPLGATTWTVDKVTSPVQLDPEERYSHVRVSYLGEGGQTFTKLVAASPAVGFTSVYNLDWDNPPHEVVATLFAQMVANELSKLRHSGQAAFTTVSGGQKGTRVKPGDKLTFPNDGGVTCTVDQVRHDADSSITTVHLVTGQPLLNRWLEKRQRLLNKGWGADRATAGFLDMADPSPPTGVTVSFTNTVKKEGRADYDMIVDVTHSGLDVDGNGTHIERIHVKYRPTDASNVPIPKSQGGGWKQRRYKLDQDDLVDDTAEDNYSIKIENVPHPNKWKWEVKAAVIDVQHDESTYTSAAATVKPANFGPPTPQPGSLSIDVDTRVTTVAWSYPFDTEDTEKADNSIAGTQVQLSTTASAATRWNSANIVKQDKKVKGEQKRFRLTKIGSTTVYARIRFFDAWGNFSTWLEVSGSRAVPPLPVISAATFDARGPKQAKYRAIVPVTVNDAGHNDNVKWVRVEFVHKATNATPTGSDKSRRELQRVGKDLQAEVTFGHIPKGDWCFARAMSVDNDEKESAWSGWTALGRARDSAAAATPGQPGTVTVTNPTPRRFVARWPDPDDDDTIRWQVTVKKGATYGTATIVEGPVTIRNNKYVYRAPEPDWSALIWIAVAPISDTGHIGTESVGSVTGTEQDQAGALPNPPNVPGVSATYDDKGTAKSRWRIVATATVPATDATHDAADDIVIRVAHGPTSGATPPSDAERVHDVIPTDGAAADLKVAFKGIPKHHYAWVRGKARNAGGPSAWTSWISLGQASTFDISDPPTVGVVTGTQKGPRRIVFDWPDPNNEETVRYRVRVFQEAGATDTLVEDEFTNNTRYTFRMTKSQAQSGAQFYARVRPINDRGDEGTESSSWTAATGEDDFDATPIGSYKPHGGNDIPTKWVRAQGQQLSKSTYAELYAVYGNKYTPTSETTGSFFRVPDLRSRGARGTRSGQNDGDTDQGAANLVAAESSRADDHHGSSGTESGELNGSHKHGDGDLWITSGTIIIGNTVTNIPGQGTRVAAGESHGHHPNSFTGMTGAKDSAHSHALDANGATTARHGRIYNHYIIKALP